MRVLTLCGSLRQLSYNRIVLETLPDLAPAGMTVAEAPGWREFPLYDADLQAQSGFPAAVATLGAALRAADGVIVVTPEYNYSIPGGLKNALDWVSRLAEQPFAGKPVALQSASMGMLGGARAQYDLRRAMVFLDALVLNKPEVMIGNCAQKMDPNSRQVTDEATRDAMRRQLAAFAAFIERHGAGGPQR